MTSPLRRIAASLTGLAVGIIFFAATFAPSGADAQSTAIKRAAPPAKAHGKSAARTPSSSWVPNPAVNGKDAYLILDATSGRELVADRADELRHPASLTKLMTIYLAFSALDSGRLSLGDALPVSINALNAPPTKIGLPPSGTVNVRDAIMALVTRSANDAAVVIAEALGGDEASFAQLMTRKAHQLGMSSTVYRNASGLPNREQVTTARDLARLAFALMRDFPHYYAIFSVQSYPYHGRILENHNRMLLSYEGADGLKTGYTVASGFNLVMSAMRDNRRLIGVVMGGDSASQRDRMMADLMDYGFTTAQSMPALGLDFNSQAGIGALHRRQFRSEPGHSGDDAATGRGGTARARARRTATRADHLDRPARRRPCRPAAASGSRRDGRPVDRQLGDPGRVVQRFTGGSTRAGTRLVRPAQLDALDSGGDRRRSADGEQELPSRSSCQSLAGPGGRRLQAAREAQDLLLGDPGHCLEYPGRALRARLQPADERPLVTALPERQIPQIAAGLQAALHRLEHRHRGHRARRPHAQGHDAIARPLVGRKSRDITRAQPAHNDARDGAVRIAHDDGIAGTLHPPPRMTGQAGCHERRRRQATAQRQGRDVVIGQCAVEEAPHCWKRATPVAATSTAIAPSTSAHEGGAARQQ